MSSDGAPTIDPDRLQHEPEYRKRVIREIADRFRQKAEDENFDTTYEQLAEDNPELTEEVSSHVEAKIESVVEQMITKERLRRGKIRRGDRPRRSANEASSGGSRGADAGTVVALPNS